MSPPVSKLPGWARVPPVAFRFGSTISRPSANRQRPAAKRVFARFGAIDWRLAPSVIVILFIWFPPLLALVTVQVSGIVRLPVRVVFSFLGLMLVLLTIFPAAL